MNIQNQPSFGMALYMPSQSKISKKIGSYAAGEAEKARGMLNELAKDVDIYVKPEQSYNKDVRRSCLRCMITNLGQNPISRYFNRNSKKANTYVGVYEEPFSEKLVKTVQKLKEDFIKYSK